MKYCTWATHLTLLLLLLVAFSHNRPAQAQERGPIYSVAVEGIVTTTTTGYLQRALRFAEASDATVLIIQLSSEGAVLRSLRPIATQLVQANVPVVVYVMPEGTESGAAGTFLLSAAHIAAMAPQTSFGSSTPLANVDRVLTEQTKQLVFDSVAQELQDWNAQRGRNTAWIDRAVREGVLLTNEQAFTTNPPTVDMIAQDTTELLTLLEGRIVELENGEQITLETLGRSIRPIHPTLWEELLLLLSSPTVAFFLLVMGFVAIYAELAHPSVGFFAGVGFVLLTGGLFGLVVLPVRWISLVGLVIAFMLVAVDIFVPTQGGLTVAGLALMIVSALTLIDAAQAPNVFIALWAIILVAIGMAFFAAVTVWLIIRLRGKPVETGQEGLVGRLAEVRKPLTPEGMVFVDGALWRAICEHGEADIGEWVRITSVHALRLVVSKTDMKGAQPLATESKIDPIAGTKDTDGR